MLVSILDVGVMQKLSFLVFILCVLISFKNQNADTKKGINTIKPTSSSCSSSLPLASSPVMSASQSVFLSIEDENLDQVDKSSRSLEYDYYRHSCPQAEKTVRAMVRYLYKVRPEVAPALLRLVFHDCFIEGCDASILLDDAEGINSEKDSPANENLNGFDIIDIIKEEIEDMCPGVVSCADVLVLAAREGVVLAGGPFYPLSTGRRDSLISFPDIATFELPPPQGDLSDTLASFASRGFDAREIVALLGAHSIGMMHCKFFENRLYNFSSTNKPDPSLNPDFLNILRTKCSSISATSSAPSPSFEGSPSSSSAPSAHLNGSPSSSAAPSPYLDGSPSSAAAPPAHLDDSPSSPAAQSPYFDGSPSSSVSPAPHLDGLSSSSSSSALPATNLDIRSSPSAAPASHIDGSPLSSATPASHIYGSPLSSAASLLSFAELSSPPPEGPGVRVAEGQTRAGFGTVYYRSLLQGKGILYSDQQLMAGDETGIWVRAYASDISLFRRDFALAMMKLSNLRVLTAPMGQIRLNCSKVA